MTANTLYYTLSTIAQTLAAGIALLAAFVLYRLQGLRAAVAEHQNKVEQFIGGQDRASLDELKAKGDLAGFLRCAREHATAAATHLAVPIARLDSLCGSQTKILRSFRTALGLTAGTIGGCPPNRVNSNDAFAIPWS